MKQIFVVLLLCALLCGCAAAGPAPEMTTPSDPINAQSQPSASTVPIGTIPKNPGLTVDPYDPEDKVPEITEDRIRKDYCDAHQNVTMEQVKLRFMGVFGEVYVMFVDVKGMMYAEVITTEKVGGVSFVYSNSQKMQVWFDGEFYTLAQAFDAGILTQEELQTLSRNYYSAYPHLWQHVPLPE